MSIDKLDLQTPDLVNENFEKLAALFPNCVTESADGKAIDFDLLKQELSNAVVEGTKERYRLEWPGKREAIVTANLPTTKTLRPVREDSVDFDNTENLYIEGDNLEVLKLLQESYLGKIKMIYIDPPYNTGKDFVYRDNFTSDKEQELFEGGQKDEYNQRLVVNPDTSGRYHSDWLTMMYPRLKLSRNLMRDDGVIFISIDDSEVASLRKICDEIFGAENFLACMVLITGANQSGEGVKIQTNTEYCLAYANSNQTTINRVDKVEESLRSLNDAPTPLETRPDMGYTIYYHPVTKEFIPVKDYNKDKIYLNNENDVYTNDESLIEKGFVPIRPGIRNNKLHRWRWGFDTFMERKGEIVITRSKNGYSVSFTQSGFNAPKNVLNYGSGTIEVKALFDGVKIFDFPKSVAYLNRLLSIGSSPSDVILDFFAGSATTAHAVMQLNAEDGGKRQFIMVQLPEPCDEKSEAFKAGYKTIAEIGKERIRRAGKKIKAENITTAPDLDIGFRVFKVDTSNMRDVYYTPDKLKQENLELFKDHIKPDRMPEDLLFQVLIDWGIDLSLPVELKIIDEKTIFIVDTNALVACFDKGVTEEFVKKLAAYNPLRVVFRDDAFESDAVKINAEQIFKLLSPGTEVKSI